MYGFVRRYFLIELIRVDNRTVLNTGRTTGAAVFNDIPGLFYQGDLEISCLSFDAFNFGIAQDLYILMPADLDQFR